jgi:hypothetical protein
MQLPEFHAEYLQKRREALFQTHARIQQNSGAAAAVLLKLMADPATPASVRARACLGILEHSNRALEVEDLELRLRRLEDRDNNQGG